MERQTRPARPAPGAARGDEAGKARGTDDDGALIAAAVRADRAALGALYDRHAPLLLALALRLLGERAAADEALHDLFVDVWHHARDYDPGRGSVRTWLVGRMRALALSRRVGPPPAPPVPALDIAGLPADLAAVVELTYFAGLPVEGAAARLGLPAALVKDRLGRALALLRQRVHTPGQEEGDQS